MAQVDEVARAAAAAPASAAASETENTPPSSRATAVPSGEIGSSHEPRPIDEPVAGLDHHLRRRANIERRRGSRVPLSQPQSDGDVVLDSQVINWQGTVGDEERDGAAVRVGVVLDFEEEGGELL